MELKNQPHSIQKHKLQMIQMNPGITDEQLAKQLEPLMMRAPVAEPAKEEDLPKPEKKKRTRKKKNNE